MLPGHRFILLVLLTASVLSPAPLRADIFHLASGGKVEGEWLNKEEKPLLRYVVKQPSGLVVKLTQDQVREHLRESPAEHEYEELALLTADTVSEQWKLANWCRAYVIR